MASRRRHYWGHWALVGIICCALSLAIAAISVPDKAFGDESGGKTYTITYKNVKASENKKNPAQVKKGKVKLTKPSRTGYSFKGWYYDKKCKKVVKGNKLTVRKNVTVYAKWQPKTYKITYKNVKGANKNAKKFTYGKNVKLKNLKKSGYTFLGWYSDKYLTKKVKKVGGKTAKNVTVYAKWVKKPTNSEQRRAVADAKEALEELHGGYEDEAPTGCSRYVLIKALRSSGYSKSAATFAADNCGANWYLEAKWFAESCADAVNEEDEGEFVTASSVKAALKKLKFKSAEISYGIKNARINWVEQAAIFVNGYFSNKEEENEDWELGLVSDYDDEWDEEEGRLVTNMSPKQYGELLNEVKKLGVAKGIKANHLDKALATYRNVDWDKSAACYVETCVRGYENRYGESPYYYGEHEIDYEHFDLIPKAYDRILKQGMAEGYSYSQMYEGFRRWANEDLPLPDGAW